MAGAAPVLGIDLGALVENWQTLAQLVAPARCGAVVKADAYGLGATPVVRALLRAGCREFFVAVVEEGIRLLDSLGAGWPRDARLHVLHGAPRGAEAECLARGLVPVLDGVEPLRRWQALARAQGRALRAALQLDTGMARLGFAAAVLADLVASPEGLAGIAPTLVMSQLVGAEDPQQPLNRRQLELFRPWRQRFPSAWGCLAASAGIFLGRDFHFDLVRPGAAIYGAAPLPGEPNPMRPVVSLQGFTDSTAPRTEGGMLDVDALARQSGTSAFEVLTTLGARHRRQYRGEVSL